MWDSIMSFKYLYLSIQHNSMQKGVNFSKIYLVVIILLQFCLLKMLFVEMSL